MKTTSAWERRRAHAIAGVALVVVLGVAAFSSSADAGRRSPPTVYWLGHSFEGLPLVARLGFPAGFVYERCRRASASTCEVQVQNWLLRYNHPARYAPEVREGCVRTRIRGAPAAFFGDHLDVYTGRRSVRIFAGTRNQALRAALALRPERRAAPSSRRLPPPAMSVRRALRTCRTLPPPLTG